MLIPSSKVNVDFYNASVGDTFTYKSKEYAIVGTEYDAGFMVHKCVRVNPIFIFEVVHELYKD